MADWQAGATLDLEITDLNSTGDGLGRWDGRVVFVPDTVPGDTIRTKLVQVKPTFARGKLVEVVTASAERVRPACIVADKCGGCQWQAVSYEAQLAAKQQQVEEALRRIGGFADLAISPILGAENSLGYRNKVTYPLARSSEGQVKAGYYRKGSHKLVNLNQCPVQDGRLNPLLAEVKQDIQAQGWSIYDEKRHHGRLRHLSLRIGRRTGQILLTLVSTVRDLQNLEKQAQVWLERYPDLVGVCLNYNPAKTNAILGEETRAVAGRPYLEESFAGLTFRIHPTTFFQVYTEQAERILGVILEELALQGSETVIDAYAGVGTLTLPVAQRSRRCIGLEVQPEAVQQGLANAALNDIENVEFRSGSVEQLLPQVAGELEGGPDVVLLDPPRKGCDRTVLDALIELNPARIVYMSCNPATLARDLKILCEEGGYRIQRVQPADFFPQTAHVECAAFLIA
ncbi:23S rRNA (uracil(1939)-C(5))-methyltransferase RlmD [Pseudanabaena sp. FACHB-2040]|uniref:23S rRNA (uracil(1939)-C(5))-methyltransferase RlmD n=1 Tax=Pseudanabaena sp. FACHB-2040 TaxID=2692859 RepID=UPI001686EF16|nr:23S rRNA (uracil(1939)-C(5))-methyltransferase RlmD [Pseudanabaena sp. FACHB-2040]MBD2259688.1 23S rRNA (uracil(1939)-C(5))-methyltransferase RlmD [Pseudanabaena sp. FACHB-2040]